MTSITNFARPPRRRLALAALALSASCALSIPFWDGDDDEGQQGGGLPPVAALVDQVGNVVVNVSAYRKPQRQQARRRSRGRGFSNPDDLFRRFFGDPRGFFDYDPRQGPESQPEPEQGQRPRRPDASASGFVLSEDGYVLTNYHVVRDAERVVVALRDRRELEAEIVGLDETTDLALLKIDADDLPHARLGDSEKTRIGEWVVAIGSPFGLSNSVTAGVISAKSRGLPARGEIGRYVPFLQTDVAINPGNSGGPLFNLRGEVVGVNAQIYTRSGGYMGLSFAIPSNVVRSVVKQLTEDGEVRRGWLGVNVQSVNADLADALGMDRAIGALVVDVLEDSPADKAGLKTGDVILSVNDTGIEDSSELPPAIGLQLPDSEVELRVVRNGKEIELPVTLGELGTSSLALAGGDNILGLQIEDLGEEEMSRMRLSKGVRVTGLADESPARGVVREGDILLSINGNEVESVEHYGDLAARLREGDNIWIAVLRGRSTIVRNLRLR